MAEQVGGGLNDIAARAQLRHEIGVGGIGDGLHHLRRDADQFALGLCGAAKGTHQTTRLLDLVRRLKDEADIESADRYRRHALCIGWP